jgi:hypothetical protein
MTDKDISKSDWRAPDDKDARYCVSCLVAFKAGFGDAVGQCPICSERARMAGTTYAPGVLPGGIIPPDELP